MSSRTDARLSARLERKPAAIQSAWYLLIKTGGEWMQHRCRSEREAQQMMISYFEDQDIEVEEFKVVYGSLSGSSKYRGPHSNDPVQ
jgi:hypothetical protein